MRRSTLRRPAGPSAVLVGDGLLNDMLVEARLHAPNETGGVLLGYPDATSGVIRVSELVSAGPDARREPHFFQPDGSWQRKQIAERYAASGRTLAYLGDWHSHPVGGGPSPLDRSTARRIAKTRAARCPNPLMLIVVCFDGRWELCAYRYTHRRLGRVEVATSPLGG